MKMKTKAFSLVELLIYFAIFGLVSVLLVNLFVTTAKDRGHIESRTEVQQNMRYSMTRIAQAIHSATGINGIPGASLSLILADASKNPTVFDLLSGVLRITEGAGSALAITSGKVTVSALTFTKISNPAPAKPAVQINITIVYNDNGNTQLAYSQNQITTVTLKQ